MRIALLLVVALVCVAVVAAGSGNKRKSAKETGNREERNKREASDKRKDDRSGENNGQESDTTPHKSRKTKHKTDQGQFKREKSKADNFKQEKAKADKYKQEKVKPDKYKEEKIKPDKYKQEKVKPDKYKEEKIKPDKYKQDKVKPDKYEQEKTESYESEPVEARKERQSQEKENYRQVEKEERQETVETEECDGDVTVESEEVVSEPQGECSRDDCGNGEPEVTLASGAKLKGTKGKTEGGRMTAEYKGVPYAEPPQAADRLKEAVLKEWWPGVLEADSAGNDCIQYAHFTYSVLGSEDCLYLNIYTPWQESAEAELLPVVVYIHGGAFMFFSSAEGGPKYLLEKDLVLVTFNYRLGPLGFFTLGDDSVAGNLGLRDQTTALKWIQRNIKSFGGDPSRVTIAGMSAGGASVHYHMLSPLSKGLFSKAISVSGTALNPWAEAENLVEKSREVARKLGCDSDASDSILACLRSRPAERIVATAKDMQVWLYNPISPWAPSPDPFSATSAFLPDSPINIIKQGKANHVPWLVSWTSQEGGYPAAEFLFNASLRRYLETNWSKVLPHLLEYNYTAPSDRHHDISTTIKQFYLETKSADQPAALQPIVDMVSDRLFLEGIGEGIKSHASLYQSPIYTYRFSHVSNDSVASYLCQCPQTLDGACHADDIGYILDALTPVLCSEQDLQISKNMVNMWYTFISTGIPVYGDQLLPRVSGGHNNVIPFLDIEQGGSHRLSTSEDLGNQAFWAGLGLSDTSHRTTDSQTRKDEL